MRADAKMMNPAAPASPSMVLAMGVDDDSAPVTSLLALPEELLDAVMEACDSQTLLRAMPACRAFHALAGNEVMWEARLADLWKNKCDPMYGQRRWWWCELTRRRDGTKETRAMPSPCANSPWLRALHECSFRESYKASMLDAGRSLMHDEELLGHVWTLKPAPPEGASANDSSRSDAEPLAIFRADGTYVDSLGVHAPWEMHPPPAGAKYPPPAVNVARIGPHFISRTDDWGWALTNIRRGVLSPAVDATAPPMAAAPSAAAPTGGDALVDVSDDAPAGLRAPRSLRRRVAGCVIIGLPHRPEINGSFCAIESYDEATSMYTVRCEEAGRADDAALEIDEDGEPCHAGAGDVHSISPVHVALPKGARVRLLGGYKGRRASKEARGGSPRGEGVATGAKADLLGGHLDGKEGRVVESPVPSVWAVPIALLNLSAMREHVGKGLVTVRLSASDEIRVAPGQCVAALD